MGRPRKQTRTGSARGWQRFRLLNYGETFSSRFIAEQFHITSRQAIRWLDDWQADGLIICVNETTLLDGSRAEGKLHKKVYKRCDAMLPETVTAIKESTVATADFGETESPYVTLARDIDILDVLTKISRQVVSANAALQATRLLSKYDPTWQADFDAPLEDPVAQEEIDRNRELAAERRALAMEVMRKFGREIIARGALAYLERNGADKYTLMLANHRLKPQDIPTPELTDEQYRRITEEFCRD